MSKKNIEEQLAEARKSLKNLIGQRTLRDVVPEYRVALEHRHSLRLERLVAERRGEPYVSKWKIPRIWKGMTLDCLVLGDQLKCFVVFESKFKSSECKILEFRQIAATN